MDSWSVYHWGQKTVEYLEMMLGMTLAPSLGPYLADSKVDLMDQSL